MTDQASLPAFPPVAPVTAASLERAVRIANRHSRHVRILRGLMITGVVALIGGIVGFTIVDPFHRTVDGVSIAGASLDGTKVTMASPKLSGYHKDGRPYEISATSAIQDIKAPTIFELHGMKARLTMSDKTVTNVTGDLGVYNSADEIMNLTTAVHIVSDSGLDMHTQGARVEFKTSTVQTNKPVSVTMRGNSVEADSMVIVDGGRQVTFDGHVHSLMVPSQQTAAGDSPAADATP